MGSWPRIFIVAKSEMMLSATNARIEPRADFRLIAKIEESARISLLLFDDITGGLKMIMRVYRCTVVEGKEDEHRESAFKKRHPSLSRKPGLIAFYAGKPATGSDDRTRCMVQIWESMEALTSALGDYWDQPMKAMPDEVRDIYDSATVEHFELADQFQITKQ